MNTESRHPAIELRQGSAESHDFRPGPDVWIETARALGRVFASRARRLDARGEFVATNYQELRLARLFSVGVPRELGGAGVSYPVLCDIIRELGRWDGSTALAYSMHAHPLALDVFRHHHGDSSASITLGKIAGGELVLASTGASDWLGSSGCAERVDGGFRVSATKRFVSGSEGADLLVTSARWETPEGPRVLHFDAPLESPAIQVGNDWNSLGMRGTGSYTVTLEDLFVSEDAVTSERPADQWHPLLETLLPLALPLIVAGYVGLADTAVDLAVEAAARSGPASAPDVGRMRNDLAVASIALGDMIRLVDDYRFEPSLEAADAALTRKTIATEAVKRAVEAAADLVGAPGFARGHPMERIIRDIRAMHFHPLPAREQVIVSGRVALGLDPLA